MGRVSRCDGKPPAGWYSDPEMVDTRRYWDGEAWTEHRAPPQAPKVEDNGAAALVRVG
jgi:hypothetical protein